MDHVEVAVSQLTSLEADPGRRRGYAAVRFDVDPGGRILYPGRE